jgi:HD-GYP domain-containing protein (c-di-GMP phosphodiesterase class II)
MEKLNQLPLREELFQVDSEKVIIIDSIQQRILSKTENQKLISKYLEAVQLMKQTITFQIKISQRKCIGFCFDLSVNNPLSFSKDSVRAMDALRTILRFYYINNRFLHLQSHFKGDLILSLANFLEMHDEYTQGHSINVADYSKQIAKEMKLSPDVVDEIYWSGVMHDIGKLLIPKEILSKTSRLTDAEFELIRLHPDLAADALSENPELSNISQIIRHHHERFDGKGYPSGLKGVGIPLASRIICVADAYEAMTSNRPYSQKRSSADGILELQQCSGSQFDPEITQTFISILEQSQMKLDPPPTPKS